jgi:hypothetical protein
MDQADGLQFQQAEFDDPNRPRCLACSKQAETEYYRLEGNAMCADCAAAWREGQRPPGGVGLARGAMLGFGAGLAGAAGMGIVSYVTGYQLALLTIAIGYLVAKAVLHGTRGFGGRRVQLLAVGLTYLGITLSYVPDIVKGLREIGRKEAGGKVEAEKKGGATKAAPEPAPNTLRATDVGLALLTLCLFALFSPFLMLADGFSGIINAAIVFFGLSQAWRMTARDPRPLDGPFPVPHA